MGLFSVLTSRLLGAGSKYVRSAESFLRTSQGDKVSTPDRQVLVTPQLMHEKCQGYNESAGCCFLFLVLLLAVRNEICFHEKLRTNNCSLTIGTY